MQVIAGLIQILPEATLQGPLLVFSRIGKALKVCNPTIHVALGLLTAVSGLFKFQDRRIGSSASSATAMRDRRWSLGSFQPLRS